MQPGIVGLRGAITAAWEDDLRAVREDRYDMAAGKEALAFIQRCYSLVSDLRAPIQKAWGLGGHVHVADSANVAGPGPRVSQTRIKLRNHGDLVAVEAFTYADGTSRRNPSLGLDREIKVVGVSPLTFVQELYSATVDFLQVALTLEQLHRCRDTQPDLDNFVRAVHLAVAADQENRRLTSDEVVRELSIDELSTIKLGRLLAASPEVCRDAEVGTGFASWSFLPSYNIHFFRRANTIDEYVAVAATLGPKSGLEATRGTSPPASIGVETAHSMPDGIVTFLMTDVVESVSLWIHSRV